MLSDGSFEHRGPFPDLLVLSESGSEHGYLLTAASVLGGSVSEHRSSFLDLPVLHGGAFEHGSLLIAASVLRGRDFEHRW